ncbi:hypothetical protein BHAOGJBA_2897 [Methylobacterium hispanicum]|uniref:DUF3828 domain-containing protein n=2 Tax=Methylobacterium hispanicum TaxID=270350 RepID=A0AAV4ZP74_9HYPH|nr:hypothetical protein BHAOGJBA_2897 [Methylobacterium hispanicum]
MILRPTSLMTITAALAAVPALAQSPNPHPTTVVGVVRTGTSDSAIGKYSFATRGPVADKVFAACKMDDLCDLTGRVSGETLVGVARITRVQDFAGPKDPLQWVYSRFKGGEGDFWLENDDLGRLFTPKLTDLLLRSRRASEILQSESVGASPWIGAQEWDIRGVKIEVDDVGPGRALGIVTFRNFVEEKPKPRSTTFDLVRTPEGWRIDDVQFPRESASARFKSLRMSEMLKVEIAEGDKELRDKNAKAAASGSLCGLGEGEVFTCSAGAKQYSICTSGQKFEKPHSWIEYRSGTPAKLDLAHRSVKPGTGGSFYGSATLLAKGELSYVRFSREGYDYVAFEDESTRPQRSGVVVRKGDRKIAEIVCTGGKSGTMPTAAGELPSNLVVSVPFDDDLLR